MRILQHLVTSLHVVQGSVCIARRDETSVSVPVVEVLCHLPVAYVDRMEHGCMPTTGEVQRGLHIILQEVVDDVGEVQQLRAAVAVELLPT